MRIYISHSIRGTKGVEATIEDMSINNQKAIEFGKKCKAAYPEIDFYVPADHDEFVMKAYLKGYLTEKQILDVDCAIIDSCAGILFYDHEKHFSTGMKVELEHAQKNNIPVATICEWDGNTKQIIHLLCTQAL